MQGVAAFGAESGDGVREEVHCSFWTLNLVARWGCGGGGGNGGCGKPLSFILMLYLCVGGSLANALTFYINNVN